MTTISGNLFDPAKAAEVAFVLLDKVRQSRGEATKVRFMKWIYLAERLSYERYGEPLTGDMLFSMKHGPVLSKTLRMIEAPSANSAGNDIWNAVVEVEKHGARDYLKIREDAPYTRTSDLRALSDSEIDLVEEVFKRFGRMNATELETFLHKRENCAEWHWKEGDGSNPIEMEELFPAIGYTAEQTVALVEQMRAREALEEAFPRRSYVAEGAGPSSDRLAR
ncbi:Panacea domain-containing protein [Luteimonas fraxinea]|uniref:Panacea domain-containing protein n=1 Tax=Luteimonas fraxinea TaxID=2901869 RepID=UPI001E4E4CAA|nr:Panacea domain-containing protein [Luteimonas fraxinea]MCD9125406.1 SocA family protein [Luteimonas fraxinea]